jgi:hypothetical protein
LPNRKDASADGALLNDNLAPAQVSSEVSGATLGNKDRTRLPVKGVCAPGDASRHVLSGILIMDL